MVKSFSNTAMIGALRHFFIVALTIVSISAETKIILTRWDLRYRVKLSTLRAKQLLRLAPILTRVA
jgi:hypothetical protein